jgi:hypothetical protein
MKRLICRILGHRLIWGPQQYAPGRTANVRSCQRCGLWHVDTWGAPVWLPFDPKERP